MAQWVEPGGLGPWNPVKAECGIICLQSQYSTGEKTQRPASLASTLEKQQGETLSQGRWGLGTQQLEAGL